jgi:hypothetical protein
MRRLVVFNHVTLDGAKSGNDDPEYAAFARENASGGELLFGRTTYAMMASYWPTLIADQHAPEVARGHEQHGQGRVFAHPSKGRLEQRPPPQR